MNVVAVVNPRAGSVPADAKRLLTGKLDALGYTVDDVIDLDLDDPRRQFEAIGQRKPGLVVVWGGDGTHRTALNVLGGGNGDILLLPGGTKNLLSRSLHGGRRWDAVLEAAASSPLRRGLPAGRVGEQHFFCALVVGSPALFAEAREDLRAGDLAGAIGDLGEAFKASAELRLAGSSSAGPRSEAAPLPASNAIGVLVGPLSKDGQMQVAALPFTEETAQLSVLWATIQSSWSELSGVELRDAAWVTVSASGSRLPAIADGEPIEVGNHLEAVYVENAATCIATAPAPANALERLVL
jgi:diacylglycerol kinase family enzyme